MKIKSRGAAGTPTSSQDAPQVFRMLIGPWLCPDCSNALCSEACYALTTYVGRCRAQRRIRPYRQSTKQHKLELIPYPRSIEPSSQISDEDS